MKIKPAPTKLTNTLFNVLLGFEKRIEEHDLQILGMDEMESVTVMADPDLLHQVVYNLVENAIKYTPQGGYIRMQVSREDGRITLTIRNSGKGIPKKDLPHVFERFYKADKSRGTDKSGSGLGLYLVKTIISLHGGQITVRSVEGEYCEFAFTLEEYRKTASGESSKADETGTDSKGEGKLKQGTSRRGAGKDDSSHE